MKLPPDNFEAPDRTKSGFLHIPIILAGYTGSGKDRVSGEIVRLSREKAIGTFQKSLCRFTDRPARPGEQDGVDGHFVSSKEFERRKKQGDFFYDYKKAAYGGSQYGFCFPTLQDELAGAHTFVTGGEIGTSTGLFDALGQRIRTNGMGAHPIVLFINRERRNIIEGIRTRGGSPQEIQTRVDHVERHWEEQPAGLKALNGRAHCLWNDRDPESVAREGMEIIARDMRGQMEHSMQRGHGDPVILTPGYA